MIELVLSGELPDGLDLEPLERVVGLLNGDTEVELPDGQVNLRLVDDKAIQELNKQYSGNDYATDVLSFSYLEDGEPIEGDIGDMAISVETAARQAKAAGNDLAEEVALLGLHGLLHIGGRDHASESEQIVLDRLQAKILAAAGIKYRDFSWES